MYYICGFIKPVHSLRGGCICAFRQESLCCDVCIKGKIPKMVLQFGYSHSGLYSLSTLYTAIPHMIIALELQSPTCHVSLEFT